MKRFLGLVVISAIVTTGAIALGPATMASAARGSGTGGTRGTGTGLAANTGFSSGAQLLWESPADQAHDLDLMAATGAKWLRLDFPWPSVQPTPTTWNWAPFDNIVALAKARGFTIAGLPSYTPTW